MITSLDVSRLSVSLCFLFLTCTVLPVSKSRLAF